MIPDGQTSRLVAPKLASAGTDSRTLELLLARRGGRRGHLRLGCGCICRRRLPLLRLSSLATSALLFLGHRGLLNWRNCTKRKKASMCLLKITHPGPLFTRGMDKLPERNHRMTLPMKMPFRQLLYKCRFHNFQKFTLRPTCNLLPRDLLHHHGTALLVEGPCTHHVLIGLKPNLPDTGRRRLTFMPFSRNSQKTAIQLDLR